MAEDTLREEATIEIDIQDDGISDFAWLNVIDQQSKKIQSREQLSTLQPQIVCATHACMCGVEIPTDCPH